VPGPGTTVAGDFPEALDLGTLGKGAVDVSALEIDRRRFTVRVVFQANGPSPPARTCSSRIGRHSRFT